MDSACSSCSIVGWSAVDNQYFVPLLRYIGSIDKINLFIRYILYGLIL